MRITNDIEDNYKALALCILGYEVNGEIKEIDTDKALQIFRIKEKRVQNVRRRVEGRKVKVIDLKTGEEYLRDSYRQASELTGVPVGSINAIAKKDKVAKGRYKFELLG